MKIPVHPDGITAQWLTDTLRATGTLSQVRVTACETQLLGNEKGLTGQLVRMHLAYDSDELHAPRALIAKFSAPDPQARAILHAMGFYEREVRLLIWQRSGCSSPTRTPGTLLWQPRPIFRTQPSTASEAGRSYLA